MEEPTTLEWRYEIVIPYAIRGLLIHLMNELLDYEGFMDEFEMIV